MILDGANLGARVALPARIGKRDAAPGTQALFVASATTATIHGFLTAWLLRLALRRCFAQRGLRPCAPVTTAPHPATLHTIGARAGSWAARSAPTAQVRHRLPSMPRKCRASPAASRWAIASARAIDARPGESFVADFTGLGSVRVSFD